MPDSVICACRELLRRYLRTLATVAGYFLGAAFIVAIAVLLLVDVFAKDKIINYMGTHFTVFAPLQYNADSFLMTDKAPLDSINEAFFAEPMVVTRLLPASFAAQISKLPEVLAATPFLLFRFKQGQDGHIFSVGGFDPANEKALKGTATTKKDLIAGAFIQPGDRHVVLVEETYALMWNLKVGSLINIADAMYPVIGIVRPGVRPVRADVYMNWLDAEEVINKRLSAPIKDEANIILVESAGIHNHEMAIKKVESIVSGGIINTFNCSLPAIEVMGISAQALKMIIYAVFVIILLFAANSQWASVSERSRDIAVLKAIGWKNSDVLWQILAESLIQALLGATGGIGAGYVLAMAFSASMLNSGLGAVQSELLFQLYAAVLLALSLIGVVAGLIPALRIIKTSPAEVMCRN